MFEFLKNIDLKTVGNVITMINPVAGIVVKSIDVIVNSDNQNISNESVVTILESLSKSKGNEIDEQFIRIAKNYLENRV